MLSLILMYPLLNEVRQQMWPNAGERFFLFLGTLRLPHTVHADHSHSILSTCIVSCLRLKLLVLTPTAELSLLSVFSAQACCRTMAFFFNPRLRIKLHLFTFSFTFMQWNMDGSVSSMTECAIFMTSIPFLFIYFLRFTFNKNFCFFLLLFCLLWEDFQSSYSLLEAPSQVSSNMSGLTSEGSASQRK